jgi:hypothetical protein
MISRVGVYIKCFYPDEGVWFYDELDEDRWSTRHVEIDGDGSVLVAAALCEVLSARDNGGVGDVMAYERLYGVSPGAAFPPPGTEGFHPVFIGVSEFEEVWERGRRELEDREATRTDHEPASAIDAEPTD